MRNIPENAALTLIGYNRVLRAYGLAYVSTTGPRLLNLLLYWYRKKSARHRILSSVSSWFWLLDLSFVEFSSEVPITFRHLHNYLSIQWVNIVADTFRHERYMQF